jgi:hypothetical protein
VCTAWIRDCEEGCLLESPAATHNPQQRSRWYSFAPGGAYPKEWPSAGRLTQEELDADNVEQSVPWCGNRPWGNSQSSDAYQPLQKNKKPLLSRATYVLLRNGWIPLFLRLTTIIFASTALALGVQLHNTYKESKSIRASSSPMMALIVDAIAIPYILIITYDEYFSKPLGLRPPAAKLRLVLLDLAFIIFESANLALAFESMAGVDGSCDAKPDGNQKAACYKTKSLAAVLFVALIAWLFTFTISIFRLVERINP